MHLTDKQKKDLLYLASLFQYEEVALRMNSRYPDLDMSSDNVGDRIRKFREEAKDGDAIRYVDNIVQKGYLNEIMDTA